MVRLLLLRAFILASAEPVVPGVLSRPAGPCDVDYYIAHEVLALASPGHDVLRLWLLPPVGPWFENP